MSNNIAGFREADAEIEPTIVFGFDDDSMEEDEVCMKMSAEIEEIEYTDEVTCTHKEFKSCHNTFKSVLRKSMVKCIWLYIWQTQLCNHLNG